jgi:hypothetical protein
MNRLLPVLKNTSRRSSPEYILSRMIEVLGPAKIIPQASKYYVFVYRAKTPDLVYDQHPVIQCTSLHPWGFIGFNYHWNLYRRYTWAEVLTNLYEISPNELSTALKFKIAKFKRVPR